MINLLIDVGNSEIKTGIGSSINFRLEKVKRFPYEKKHFEKDIRLIFSKLNPDIIPGRIGISLLKDADKNYLEFFFLRKYRIKPVFIRRDMKLPIRIKYSEGIGNDRICNAAAAAELYDYKNIMVIDFGTATTFTLVSNNVLSGGIILPGIKTSLSSLTKKTSLPEVRLSFPKNLINSNTIDNIKAGVLYQSLYSAERIITEAARKYKGLYVIATGGFSKLISDKSKLINKTDRYLSLKGINTIISQ